MEVGPRMMLASYVDGDALAVTEPSITALDVAPREFGRRCMELLAGALDGSIEAGGDSRDAGDARSARLHHAPSMHPAESAARSAR